MTHAGTITVGVDIAGGDVGAKLAAAMRRQLAPTFAAINREMQRQSTLSAQATRSQSRDIGSVTREFNEQTAAIEANTAARIANASAPTGGPPGRGAGGGRAGGRGGRFITSPLGLNSIALGASALPAATLAVTNLVGAIQQLSQAGLVIPGVMAGIASSVGTAALGFRGMGDAVKALNEGDLDKATKAMKDMDPAAQNVAKSVSKFTQGPLKDLTKGLQAKMFDGISQGFDDLVAKRMPNVTKGLGGISEAWNGTLKQLLSTAGSDSTGGILDRIFGNTAEGQKRANAAIEPLVKGFGTLAAAGTDALPRLGDALTSVATRFSNFITSADGDGRLAKWIDQGITGVGQLGNTFLNVGKSIAAITKAAGGDGGLLQLLETGSEKLAAFLNSADGQQKLTTFFNEAREDLRQWLPILGNVAQVAGDVLRGFQDWGNIIRPIVGSVADVLSGMGGSVSTVVTAFLAFKTFSGLASLLGSLTTLGGLLDGLGGKASGAGKGIVAGINPATAAITAALAGLNELNNRVSPQLKDATLPDIAPPGQPWYKQAWNLFQSWIPGSQFQPPGPPQIPLGGGPNAQRQRRGVDPIVTQLPQATPFDPNQLPIGLDPAQVRQAQDALGGVSQAAQDATGKVGDLGSVLSNIPAPPPIPIKVDTAGAMEQISAFAAKAGSTSITIPVRINPTSGSAFAGAATGSSSWFSTPHRADGGVFPGYAPGRDSILSWVSPGEGVLIPEAVRALGGARGIWSINSRFRSGLSRAGYADGGVVGGAIPSGLSPMAADIAAAMAQAIGPIIDLLAAIRDAVGGKAAGPLADTAVSTGRIAQSVTAAEKPYGGDAAKGALAGAVKALGGDPAQLFDGQFDASGRRLIPTGTSVLADGSGGLAASLAAFAKSGNTADLSGTGLNASSPVVSAIVSARNKKRGGLSDDDIAGLVSQVVGGGGFTGVLDDQNSALVKSLTTYRNKLGVGPVGAPAAPVDVAALGGGLGSNPLGYSGGGPVPVYIVDGPGAFGGVGAKIGGDLANSALQAGGQVLSNVSGDLIDGVNKATQLQKNSTLTKPDADTESLLKGGSPAGVASLLGYRVPDFARRGGDQAPVMGNDGPGFNANGQIFSDTAALIQRSFTDMEAANQARHEQMMAVLDGIKTQLSESVLKPIIQAAVQSAMAAAGSAAQGGGVASAIPGLAGGGGIWGGVPGRDSVPAMLMPGEHVLTATDVARMGGQSGVYAFRSALARTGGVRGFATGGGVIGNDTVGADFFGLSQVPIIGAIVNLLIKVLLQVIGVNIEVADTLNEISGQFRQFRGDFKAFEASGRLMNDTSGLVDRTGSSEQKAIDERVRIFKQVLTGLIKYIIQKIIIPITQAVLQTLLSTASSAVSGAISGAAAAGSFGAGGAAGGVVGNLVGGLMNSAGGAAINIFGELISDIAGAAVGPIVSLFTDGFMGMFGKLLSPILSGGIGGFLSTIFPFLAFDQGGVASGVGFLPKATIEPERVLSPRQTSAFERLVDILDGRELGARSTSVTVPMQVYEAGPTTADDVRNRLLALLT